MPAWTRAHKSCVDRPLERGFREITIVGSPAPGIDALSLIRYKTAPEEHRTSLRARLVTSHPFGLTGLNGGSPSPWLTAHMAAAGQFYSCLTGPVYRCNQQWATRVFKLTLRKPSALDIGSR